MGVGDVVLILKKLLLKKLGSTALQDELKSLKGFQVSSFCGSELCNIALLQP